MCWRNGPAQSLSCLLRITSIIFSVFFSLSRARATERRSWLLLQQQQQQQYYVYKVPSLFFQSVMIIDASNVLRTPGFVRQPGMLIRARAPNSLLLDLYTPPLPPPSFFFFRENDGSLHHQQQKCFSLLFFFPPVMIWRCVCLARSLFSFYFGGLRDV